MIYEINIHSSSVNKIYADFVLNNCTNTYGVKEYFIYGGAGSGKSYAVAQHILFSALLRDYYRCIYVRKVYRTVRNSQFQLFVDLINKYNLNDLFDISKTDMRIVCNVNGNMLIATGMDDAEKIKSIQDPTCVWLEEATEFELQDYLQLRTRLRKSGTDLYSICTFNPVSKKNWLYGYINDNIMRQDVVVIHSTLVDNKYINKDYEDTLNNFSRIDTNFYKVYRLGEWGETNNNKVFNNYKIERFDLEEFDCYGIDFGFANPTAVVGVKIDKETNTIYARQFLYEKGLTNDKLIKKLEELKIPKHKLIYADSEDPQRIQQIFNEGYNIHSADKNRMDGLLELLSHNIIIHQDSVDLIREIDGYSWVKTKDGDITDEIIKKDDHTIDALRYAVYTYIKRNFKTSSFIFKKLKTNII